MALEQLTHPLSTPHDHDECDIAIVGGGIAGASLACALKDSGLNVIVIEARSPAAVAARERAYHISLLSGRILAGVGVWEAIADRVTKFNQIRLSDANDAAVVRFFPQDLGTECLGYVAEHRVLCQALFALLETCPQVQWLCPAEVMEVNYRESDVEIAVNVNGQRRHLRSRLLVGADGARSRIRTAAGIRTRGWKYWQSCITTVFKHEKPHGAVACEQFWSSGPMGILPLPEGNRCQVVWTAPHAEAQALKELDERAFSEKLAARIGGRLGRIELESDRLVFPVQLMQSDRYVQHRLALIGDAAHCCHPVGGQGLNLGIRDVAALAQVLQNAHNQGEDIGSLTVLKRYERWRKLENLTILGLTDLLNRTFSNHWLPAVVARRGGLRMLQHLRPLKRFPLQLMTGLQGRMPQLANGISHEKTQVVGRI